MDCSEWLNRDGHRELVGCNAVAGARKGWSAALRLGVAPAITQHTQPAIPSFDEVLRHIVAVDELDQASAASLRPFLRRGYDYIARNSGRA